MAKKQIVTSDLSGDPIGVEGYQIRVFGPDLYSVLDVTEAEAVEYAQKGTISKKRGRKSSVALTSPPSPGTL